MSYKYFKFIVDVESEHSVYLHDHQHESPLTWKTWLKSRFIVRHKYRHLHNCCCHSLSAWLSILKMISSPHCTLCESSHQNSVINRFFQLAMLFVLVVLARCWKICTSSLRWQFVAWIKVFTNRCCSCPTRGLRPSTRARAPFPNSGWWPSLIIAIFSCFENAK